MKNTIKMMLLAAIVPASMAIQACSSSEVAFTAGAVGGAIIGSHWNDRYDNGNRYHRVYRCNRYVDYWGNVRRECRYVYERRGHWSVNVAENAEVQGLAVDGKDVMSNVSTTASQYKLSYDSAERLVAAFQHGSEGDLSYLASLGIQRDDIKEFTNNGAFSPDFVNRVAQAMDKEPTATLNMLSLMRVKAQKALEK